MLLGGHGANCLYKKMLLKSPLLQINLRQSQQATRPLYTLQEHLNKATYAIVNLDRLLVLFSPYDTYLFESRLFAVGEECSEQAAVQMIQDRDQQRLVKLERVRELKQMRHMVESSFPIIDTVDNIGIFVLHNFGNKLDRQESHLNFNLKHHEIYKFPLKFTGLLTVSNLFQLEIVQKCQCCRVRVLWENSNVIGGKELQLDIVSL